MYEDSYEITYWELDETTGYTTRKTDTVYVGHNKASHAKAKAIFLKQHPKADVTRVSFI